jgi:hypothetical protein
MKKVFILFAAAFFALQASAQKLTEKQLLGYWTMASIATSNSTVDFATSTVVLSESFKKEIEEAEWASTEKIILSNLDYARDLYMHFKPGSKLKFNLDGESEIPYSIFEKYGKSYLVEEGMPKESETQQLLLKDKKLSLIVADGKGGNVIMTFMPGKARTPAKLGTSKKISLHDLMGRWSVVEYADEDGKVLSNGTFVLAPDVADRYTAEEQVGLNNEFTEIAGYLGKLEFSFSPGRLQIFREGELTNVGDTDFETTEETYLTVTYEYEEGNEEDNYVVFSENDVLYLMNDYGGKYKCVRKQ